MNTVTRTNDHVASFCWYTNVHAVRRTGVMTFSLQELGKQKFDWLWADICAKASSTRQKPMGRSDVDYLMNGLLDAAQSPSWRPLSQCSPEDVTLEMLMRMFSEFEELLLSIYTPYKCSKVSVAVRIFLTKKFSSAARDPRIKRFGSFFRTQCPSKTSGRELISDVSHASRPLIGAVPHEDLSELQSKTAEILVTDLERLRLASLDVIRRHFECTEQLERLEKICLTEIDKSVRALARQAARDGIAWNDQQCENYFALCISIEKGERPGLKYWQKPYRSVILSHAKKLSCGFAESRAPLEWLKSREKPAYDVLLACALIIQISTGWNFTSVITMPEEMFDIRSFPHRLKSTKEKIGDETPLVMIEQSDADVILALNLLAGRLNFLRGRGYTDFSAWSGSVELTPGKLNSIVSWNHLCKVFCQRYNLPPFSLEMVRGQVMAADTVRTGDVASAQSRAGHVKSATTFHYINKVVLRRLNSANTLEFERRFDATVRYMIDPSSISKEQRLISYPIGDGSSCRDPSKPPDPAWLSNGTCTALHCHGDASCSNMTIRIDKDRIEETVLTKQYYENNWKRLFNANPEGFEVLHLNNMLFSFALYGSIARGPYRHLMRHVGNV